MSNTHRIYCQIWLYINYKAERWIPFLSEEWRIIPYVSSVLSLDEGRNGRRDWSVIDVFVRAGLICLNMSSSSAVSVFFVVGMFKWWYDLSDATKAAVIGGPLLVICILVIYCCCCRSRPANQGAVLVTPAVGPTAVMATSTNTTGHMRPLAHVTWVNTVDKCAVHAQFLINFEVFAEELRLRVYAVWCKHSQYL